MPLFCAAFGCSNLSSKEECKQRNVSFHSFPLKKPQLLERWLENIRREDFIPKQHSRLCSDHFEEGSFAFQPFTNKRCLKPDALPTIFSYQYLPRKRKKLMCAFRSESIEGVFNTTTNHLAGMTSSYSAQPQAVKHEEEEDSSIPEPQLSEQVVNDTPNDKPKVYLIRCNPQNGVVVKQLEQDGTESLVPTCDEPEQPAQMPSESIPSRKRKACESCEEAAERRHREKMQKWDRFLSLMEELVETYKLKNSDNLNVYKLQSHILHQFHS